MIKLTPSLLAADLLNLGRDIDRMLGEGLDRLHMDVMDGHFVPNMSFGPFFLQTIQQHYPDLKMDAHLMMDNPEPYLDEFAQFGAYSIILHREIAEDMNRLIQKIHRLGVKAGLSVKPATGAETLLPYLDDLDLILVMTVEPGFGGQKFMLDQVDKIRFLRKAGFRGEIAVDGGVNLQNAPLLKEAGVNLLVMGTTYFHAENRERVVRFVEDLNA